MVSLEPLSPKGPGIYRLPFSSRTKVVIALVYSPFKSG